MVLSRLYVRRRGNGYRRARVRGWGGGAQIWVPAGHLWYCCTTAARDGSFRQCLCQDPAPEASPRGGPKASAKASDESPSETDDKPSADKPGAPKPAEAAPPPEKQASACRLALTEEIAIAPSIPDIRGPGACGGGGLGRGRGHLPPGQR